MQEIDVAITDYLLALQSFWFVHSMGRLPNSQRSASLRLLFGGFALAALAGGTSHGFFNDPAQRGHALLWWLTLLFIGVTAAGFALTGLTLFRDAPARANQLGVLVLFLIYAAATIVYQDFRIAIAAYLPAVLFCLAGLVIHHQRHSGSAARLAITGLLISLLATLAQQFRIALHPVYLSHNAVYHLILLPALYLFYRGFWSLVEEEEGVRV